MTLFVDTLNLLRFEYLKKRVFFKNVVPDRGGGRVERRGRLRTVITIYLKKIDKG